MSFNLKFKFQIKTIIKYNF